jgi:hypothetical protein
MDARKPVLGLAVAAAVAACGSQSARTPSTSRLPLVTGSSVIVNVRECNHGANPYCAQEMVVEGGQYRSPKDLLFAERNYLRSQGWTSATPNTGVELAAESPGHKLRVTYATALQDLKGIDLSWIARPWSVTSALDRAVFDRVPTMSMLLEVGSQ